MKEGLLKKEYEDELLKLKKIIQNAKRYSDEEVKVEFLKFSPKDDDELSRLLDCLEKFRPKLFENYRNDLD